MSSSFLAAKIAVCPIDRARRPLWGWLAGKNHPRSAAVFFPAKPCAVPGQTPTFATRNKNACKQADVSLKK